MKVENCWLIIAATLYTKHREKMFYLPRWEDLSIEIREYYSYELKNTIKELMLVDPDKKVNAWAEDAENNNKLSCSPSVVSNEDLKELERQRRLHHLQVGQEVHDNDGVLWAVAIVDNQIEKGAGTVFYRLLNARLPNQLKTARQMIEDGFQPS